MVLRTAPILFKNQKAGTLTETADGGTLFTYDQTWQEPIACCFPISRREYPWENGLHPFFQHLGAEGWLREQQARIAHMVEEDDLGILLRYGSDCIGAVSLAPTEDQMPFPLDVTPPIINPGRTVSGVQKKLLVTTDKTTKEYTPAMRKGSAPYIAKFNSESLPTLVRNEFLSLRWLSMVLGKDEVTSFCLSNVPTLNEIALIVTRFDRKFDQNKADIKLRLEDFAQILCKPKGLQYSGKYEASYEDCAAIVLKYSSRTMIDLARFFKRFVAFAIIGNCDAHLKNFSMLETPTGLRLSPAYDVINTAMYPGYNQDLALSINGKRIALEAITEDLLFKFGQEIGLSSKIIQQIFDDLRRNVQKAFCILKPPLAEAPDGFMNRFEEIVRTTCLRILP